MRHPRHFSLPFYSRPSSPRSSPSPRTEKIPPTTLIQTRRRPSSTMRTSRRSIQFALRPDSPGKSSCKYVRNCRLYLCKHPPPSLYGNWTSEFDTANFHTRKEMLSLLWHYEFFTPYSRTVGWYSQESQHETANVEHIRIWIILFVKMFTSYCVNFVNRCNRDSLLRRFT